MLALQFLISVIAGKFTVFLSQILRLGAGGTWPGEVALTLNPNTLAKFASQLKQGLVIIAGTNGKTTTALMVQTILEEEGKTVIHNKSGANLENGLISAFIRESSWLGEVSADYAVLEVDENVLQHVISKLDGDPSTTSSASSDSAQNDTLVGKSITSVSNVKLTIILLNLFRDQLDRYGEVDVIAQKWQKALKNLPKESAVILNSDDPQIAHLTGHTKAKIMYFGLDLPKKQKKELEHATDSTHCLSCGAPLEYEGVYYSHLGSWKCTSCGKKRPKPDIVNYETSLPGLYNRYNATAAGAVSASLGIKSDRVQKVLKDMQPAFGRQEGFIVDDTHIQIFLSKNPTGFNESLRTVLDLKAKHILLVLNDRIPDGRDVSWVWDVDFEMIPNDIQVVISGDRAYDMGLRVKYSQSTQKAKVKGQNFNSKAKIDPNLQSAIVTGLKQLGKNETLFILPTYSAMLEVRKILSGRKIL